VERATINSDVSDGLALSQYIIAIDYCKKPAISNITVSLPIEWLWIAVWVATKAIFMSNVTI
jgi:hypothetical protein